MLNQVLWTLDNEMDGTRFERLCTDMLFREGYKDIIPIGGNYDRGRDAQIHRLKGIRTEGGKVFFQYTLEKKWDTKLRRELAKVRKNNHDIDFYVFVTSQKITGNQRDKLERWVRQEYQWQLIIYDREWFRHRLEEAYPDLATTHLGISERNFDNSRFREKPPVPDEDIHRKAWQLYIQQNYEAAAVEFKLLINADKGNAMLWSALAWCQFSFYRYNEALVSINRALSIDDNANNQSLKASILTEDGIKKGKKANLLLARDIFAKVVSKQGHWVDHYNYGNVLQELRDYEKAKKEFHLAIELNKNQPEIWKNLGTVYFYLHDHDSEIECYNRALELDSNLPQALVSKGTTLLNIFNRPREASDLLERAIDISDEISIHWPHVWYWLAYAYSEQDDLAKALDRVEKGLLIIPHHAALLNLKAELLKALWPTDPEYIDQALSFFKFRIELSQEDYDSVTQLAQLYLTTGQSNLAWKVINQYLDCDDDLEKYLSLSPHSIEDCLLSFRYFSAYQKFRTVSPLTRYTNLLTKEKVPLDDDFSRSLFFLCAIPFGLACSVLSSHPLDARKELLEQVWSRVQDSLEVSFPRIAKKALRELKTKSPEDVAKRLTPVLIYWPDFALIEVSGQIGYVGGIFGLSASDLDHHVIGKGKELDDWQQKVRFNTLLEINEVLGVFKS